MKRPPLGPLIAEGTWRRVYENADDPALVVKVEKHRHCNRKEWRVWQALKDTAWAEHFAPCFDIGRGWLTQARCEPVPKEFQPYRVPSICSPDAYRRNFGLLDGRLVCVDMGGMDHERIPAMVTFRSAWWRQ